jgi:hypothetical protein
MISSVSEVLATFTSALRSRWELIFEYLALSHQVMVMQRSRRKPQFGGADRFFWILLSTVWDRWPKALVVAKPATILRWRRQGIRKCWRRAKGRRKAGRPPLDAELVSLIGQMSRANCLWGAPRIHGELLKLGLKVAEATVAKYMVARRLRRGPGWGVFLRNELAGLQESGLGVELKEAWDDLKGLWAWRQWFSNGLETRMVRGPGSGSPVIASIGPRLILALASVASRNIPGSELEKPVSLFPVGAQARGPPAGELNSEHLGQQIGQSELDCNGELYDERCAASMVARGRVKRGWEVNGYSLSGLEMRWAVIWTVTQVSWQLGITPRRAMDGFSGKDKWLLSVDL